MASSNSVKNRILKMAKKESVDTTDQPRVMITDEPKAQATQILSVRLPTPLVEKLRARKDKTGELISNVVRPLLEYSIDKMPDGAVFISPEEILAEAGSDPTEPNDKAKKKRLVLLGGFCPCFVNEK